MDRLTNLTFALGADAAEAVGRQYPATERLRASRPDLWRRQVDSLGALIEKRLLRSPDGFEIGLPPGPRGALRLVWEGFGPTAGLLYTIRRGLQSISALLRDTGPPSAAAILRLRRVLWGVPQYLPCLSAVRASAPPLLATFCAGNGFPRDVEQAILVFADVYFTASAARANTP